MTLEQVLIWWEEFKTVILSIGIGSIALVATDIGLKIKNGFKLNEYTSHIKTFKGNFENIKSELLGIAKTMVKDYNEIKETVAHTIDEVKKEKDLLMGGYKATTDGLLTIIALLPTPPQVKSTVLEVIKGLPFDVTAEKLFKEKLHADEQPNQTTTEEIDKLLKDDTDEEVE